MFGVGKEVTTSILFVRPNSLRGNEVTQKLHRIPSKLTFVDSYFEVCLSEGLQDLCHITDMVLKGGTEYEYVVNVYDYKLANVISEDVFQETLKRCRSIGQSKG